MVSLDAYPDTKIKASVEHIYHESKTINNVTIYEVDLNPEEVPLFFRSGMNAGVDFIEQSRKMPYLFRWKRCIRKRRRFLFGETGYGKEALKTRLMLGISDDKNVEVLSNHHQ